MKHAILTQSLLLLLVFFAPKVVLASSVSSDDAYTKSFANYAKELNDELLTKSVNNYIDETQKIERKVGYIGKRLTLPKPVKVADGVYTIVGSLIWHNASNFGLNNNLTFIEFEDGVFVFNAGPNPAVAYSFHQIIKEYTDKPVKWVAVENSQGHAYLGASYWVDIGVKNLYSHEVSNRDFHNAFQFIKQSWAQRVGAAITASARDVTDHFTEFSDQMTVDVGGGEVMHLLNFGPGHTPGSTLVHVPSRNLLLTGDVAYKDRMLAFFSYTHTGYWIETFQAMMAAMPQDILVIPGHGGPTDMATIKRDTLDYLEYVTAEVEKVIDAETGQVGLDKIDQTQYQNRSVYEQTYRQNVNHIYKELTGGDMGQSFE